MKRISVFLLVTLILASLFSACAVVKKPSETAVVDAYAENGGKNVNYLCGIDREGRVFMPTTGRNGEKEVGLFYFLWLGYHQSEILDNTKLLKEDPDRLWNASTDRNAFHYWGEPHFGYYKSTDPWIISRHAEMFIAAGIDYLIFDTTNAYTYLEAVETLCEVFYAYQKDGWDVPKIAFFTNTASAKTMKQLYDNFYFSRKWESLWYKPDGVRPLIIGALPSDYYENPVYIPRLPEDFTEKFEVRAPQWPNVAQDVEKFPWMDWRYPQTVFDKGVMSVSVAQHPQLPMSNSYFDRRANKGRGYNVNKRRNSEAEMEKGLNFQSQWNTALRREEVKNVFVTGWNEWVAQKIDGSFVDCFNEEFSRDIEPMKGGYEDNFYLQLCDNVRRFDRKRETFLPSDKATIDVFGELSQWDGIRNIYYAITKNPLPWDVLYVDGKGFEFGREVVNNMQKVTVTSDDDKVYFRIDCEKPIVVEKDEAFMNIFLGINELKRVGWEGYSFVLDGNGNLSALDEKGNRTFLQKCKVSIKGEVLQAELPMASLGLTASDLGIYFKVADGVDDEGIDNKNIMDYYKSGKAMPMGRLSYYYYFN